ncbi:UNVERIFIED_CONTAM: hypothetical protein Sangu_2564000 [Sesamum angustifolium]|uniref:Uncharacterized protein n=1 Tax=Sesamum angustifolium TaxID=2727405 RepID=A0AAW2J7K7_9LAMI
MRARVRKRPFPVRSPRPARDDPPLPRGAASSSFADSRQGSELGTPGPALRANPFPEVTDPFCRLPLPTLFHDRAVHLGGPDAVMSTTGADGTRSSGFSRAAGGAPDHHATCGALPAAGPYLRLQPFPGGQAVKQEKINSSEAPADVSGLPKRCRQPPRPGSGILTDFPFGARAERAVCRASPDP